MTTAPVQGAGRADLPHRHRHRRGARQRDREAARRRPARQVGFTEGQDVKAGQLLAQIDPRTLQAQLAQAQAQKARKDEATLANARVDLQRYTTLIAQDAATQQQLDTQKALVGQLEATVKTDDAQINFAQVQLGFTTSPRRSAAASARAWSTPATSCTRPTPTASSSSTRSTRSSVVFTLPEDAVQDINHALRRERRAAAGAGLPARRQRRCWAPAS